MINQVILVADSDPKNLLILKENLQASGFQVITANDGNKAWDETQINMPGLILSEINLPNLNGFKLLEKLHSDPNTSNIPMIFLTNQRDVQQRVKAFQLGAKDYLVKPLHVKEVIAHIRMVLRRIKKLHAAETKQYQKLSGKLQEVNLADLIENFSIDRKSGILTINNGNDITGHIYFRDGIIINASLGNFSPENAIYQMLPWKNGYFNMLFKEVDDIKDVVSISNLGILLEGYKRIEHREKYLQMFPSSDTVFKLSASFKEIITKKSIPDDIREFIALFDGERTILDIIDSSSMDDLKTLERLSRLYNHGFIEIASDHDQKAYIRPEFEQSETIAKEDDSDRTIIEEPEQKVEFIGYGQSDESGTSDLDDESARFTAEEAKEGDSKGTESETPAEAEEFLDEADTIKEALEPEETEEVESELPEFERPIHKRIQETKKKVHVPEDVEYHEYHDIEEMQKLSLHRAEEREKERQEEVQEDASELDTVEEYKEKESLSEKEYESDQISETSDSIAQPTEKKVTHHVVTSSNEVAKEKRIMASKDKDQLLVIGFDEDGLDEVMDLMTNNKFKTKQLKPLDNLPVHFGKITESDYNFITLLGVFINQSIAPFINAQKDKLMGVIFIIDCSNSEYWEYANYLIHSIWSNYHVPYSIALANSYEDNAKSGEVMRDELNLGEDDSLFIWNGDESSIKTLLKIIQLPGQTNNSNNSEMRKRMVEKVTA